MDKTFLATVSHKVWFGYINLNALYWLHDCTYKICESFQGIFKFKIFEHLYDYFVTFEFTNGTIDLFQSYIFFYEKKWYNTMKIFFGLVWVSKIENDFVLTFQSSQFETGLMTWIIWWIRDTLLCDLTWIANIKTETKELGGFCNWLGI